MELFSEYNPSNSENDENKLLIDPNSVSKEKFSTLLSQQPMIHNVLTKNQPLKIRKISVKQPEKTRFTQRSCSNLLGKLNNYKSYEMFSLSLGYPAKEYDCGIFFNVIDNYDISLKIIICQYDNTKQVKCISWN